MYGQSPSVFPDLALGRAKGTSIVKKSDRQIASHDFVWILCLNGSGLDACGKHGAL